jgi:hypothetical protein
MTHPRSANWLKTEEGDHDSPSLGELAEEGNHDTPSLGKLAEEGGHDSPSLGELAEDGHDDFGEVLVGGVTQSVLQVPVRQPEQIL